MMVLKENNVIMQVVNFLRIRLVITIMKVSLKIQITIHQILTQTSRIIFTICIQKKK
jgi:hypothetical protein